MSAIPAALSRTSASVVVKRHPLISYFTLAFVGTWLFYAPILLSRRGLGLINLPDAAGLLLFMLATYAGPLLSALITTLVVDGPGGIQAWLSRLVQWRVGLRWYLLVLIGYPVVFGAAAIVALGPQSLGVATAHLPAFVVGYLIQIPVAFFLPTLGEEAGWRGFALPRLQRNYGPLPASLMLGSLHALWHLPAYWVKGQICSGVCGPDVFLANSLGIIAATLVWTWLFNHTAGSIFFATYVHAVSNAVSILLPRLLNIRAPDPWFLVEVTGAAALVVLIASRGRLGYSNERPVER